MTTLIRLVLGLSLCSALFGCDDDDGLPPEYRSGVDSASSSSTPVSNLDERDQRAICESLNAYTEATIDADQAVYVACLPQALVLGIDTADCERRVNDCMALAPRTSIRVQVDAQNVQACINDVRRCNATVAELEACVNVNVDAFYDILGWSCDRIDDPNARRDAAQAMRTVSACANSNAACGDVARIRPD